MSTTTVYTCNRCGKETREGRSYWTQVKHEYTGSPKDLCPVCTQAFKDFMKNLDVKRTYVAS